MTVVLKLDQPTNQPMEQNLCGAHTCFGTQGKIFFDSQKRVNECFVLLLCISTHEQQILKPSTLAGI